MKLGSILVMDEPSSGIIIRLYSHCKVDYNSRRGRDKQASRTTLNIQICENEGFFSCYRDDGWMNAVRKAVASVAGPIVVVVYSIQMSNDDEQKLGVGGQTSRYIMVYLYLPAQRTAVPSPILITQTHLNCTTRM